ncbi:MAG: hypothetical protein WDO73_06575 [Ignavibacteriota bacterium]
MPVPSNLATNPSPTVMTGWALSLAAPPDLVWKPLSTGKFVETVFPPTYTLPEPSSAREVALSSSDPPK